MLYSKKDESLTSEAHEDDKSARVSFTNYQKFADVYDVFMEDTPYDMWTEYIREIFKKHRLVKKTNTIVDLGCGTGNMTTRLAKYGYDMIGVDISEQMLTKAMQKTTEEDNILYLNQDMRELELYGSVDAIISICDSINYITEDEELLQVFKSVYKYLEPNGLFVFDINSVYKFREILGCNSFCETTDNLAYTWENYFDEEEYINEFYTNFFIKQEDSDLYQRYEEFHYERAYEVEEIIEFLERAGLKFESVYDEITFHTPTSRSQRIFFVARKI